MASDELINLIDLSLGVQPQGVVNFNYLHGLLHEIVKRLMIVEGLPCPHHDQVKQAQKKDVTLGVSTSDVQGLGSSGSVGSADDEEDGGRTSSPELAGTAPLKQVSSLTGTAPLKQVSSLTRSRPAILTAANDLGALERKIQDLERRVNTMESLPEMLTRMATDSNATPVSDMWNFTNLDKRLTATEQGLEKVNPCLLLVSNFIVPFCSFCLTQPSPFQ